MKKLIAVSYGLMTIPFFNAMADTPPESAKIICSTDGQECVAVGTLAMNCFNCSRPVAYVSHDGKKTWKLTLESPDGLYSTTIDSFDCRKDLKHCVAIGNIGVGHERHEMRSLYILTSHDKGHHWIEQQNWCGGMSFTYMGINDHYCNPSWSHCVAVGVCNPGMGQDRGWAIAMYLEPASNDKWSFANGLKYIAKYYKLKTITCFEEEYNKLTCKASGEASDTGSKWWKITAISKDFGKTWVWENPDRSREEYIIHSPNIL